MFTTYFDLSYVLDILKTVSLWALLMSAYVFIRDSIRLNRFVSNSSVQFCALTLQDKRQIEMLKISKALSKFFVLAIGLGWVIVIAFHFLDANVMKALAITVTGILFILVSRNCFNTIKYEV